MDGAWGSLAHPLLGLNRFGLQKTRPAKRGQVHSQFIPDLFQFYFRFIPDLFWVYSRFVQVYCRFVLDLPLVCFLVTLNVES